MPLCAHKRHSGCSGGAKEAHQPLIDKIILVEEDACRRNSFAIGGTKQKLLNARGAARIRR